MAIDKTGLTHLLHENAPVGEFRPCAFYDSESDALTVYFSNEPDHGRRLNSRVTVYLSDETEDLVGCRIKGVRMVLDDIGSFDVSISHGRMKLKMLFVALHGTFATDEDGRSLYRRLGEAFSQTDLEVEVPQAIS